MKKWIKPLGSAGLLALTVASALILTLHWPVGHAVGPVTPVSDAARAPDDSAQNMDATMEAGEVYMLRELDGYIAVYCPPEADTPVQKTDIRVVSLRRNDSLKLREGISVSGRENMLKLLEDFCL